MRECRFRADGFVREDDSRESCGQVHVVGLGDRLSFGYETPDLRGYAFEYRCCAVETWLVR